MTIVQVLTQQVERVNDLESEIKEKEKLIKKAEVDLSESKEELKREKESLVEKEKAFDQLITSQRQKEVEESMVIEELKVTKELLSKANQDLDAKSNELDAQLEKVRMTEVSTQTVSSVKHEEKEAQNELEQKEIPCKYFQRIT